MINTGIRTIGRRSSQVAERLGKHPTVVLSMASLAYRCGKDYYRLRRGEFDAVEFRSRAGVHVTGITGSFGGAAVGASIGSVVPGVGTVIGGFAGGVLGEYAGTKAGREIIEFTRRIRKPSSP